MNKLDVVLLKLLELISEKSAKDFHKTKHGLVAAALLTADHKPVYATSQKVSSKKCKHAERCVIEEFQKEYGDVPKDAILVTTLSPCFEPMSDREGGSCCDLIKEIGITKVYTGLDDWSQEQYDKKHYDSVPFNLVETNNSKIKNLCNKLLETISKSQKIVK